MCHVLHAAVAGGQTEQRESAARLRLAERLVQRKSAQSGGAQAAKANRLERMETIVSYLTSRGAATVAEVMSLLEREACLSLDALDADLLSTLRAGSMPPEDGADLCKQIAMLRSAPDRGPLVLQRTAWNRDGGRKDCWQQTSSFFRSIEATLLRDLERQVCCFPVWGW